MENVLFSFGTLLLNEFHDRLCRLGRCVNLRYIHDNAIILTTASI